jgi:hypothetical protein
VNHENLPSDLSGFSPSIEVQEYEAFPIIKISNTECLWYKHSSSSVVIDCSEEGGIQTAYDVFIKVKTKDTDEVENIKMVDCNTIHTKNFEEGGIFKTNLD